MDSHFAMSSLRLICGVWGVWASQPQRLFWEAWSAAGRSLYLGFSIVPYPRLASYDIIAPQAPAANEWCLRDYSSIG